MLLATTSRRLRDDFATGWDGVFGIIGQDHDGDCELATQSIFFQTIDISSSPLTRVQVALGALNSEPDFSNYEAVDGDGIDIFAAIDGGTEFLIGSFRSNASGASDLYLDTDLDGIGDGTRLTVELTDFTFDILDIGANLDLRIDLTSTASFEPLAVDNLRVTAVPEPSSFAILAVGTTGFVARRYRRRSPKR